MKQLTRMLVSSVFLLLFLFASVAPAVANKGSTHSFVFVADQSNNSYENMNLSAATVYLVFTRTFCFEFTGEPAEEMPEQSCNSPPIN